MTALPPPRRGAPVLATVRKALTAAGFAFAGALGAAMLDGDLTTAEAIVSTGTGLIAGVATYQVKNTTS